jgi:tetratricopeptide (TPR) repeat protein
MFENPVTPSRINVMESPRPQFLDVDSLIELSESRPRSAWLRFGVAGFLLAMMMSWFVGHGGQSAQTQEVLTTVIGLGLATMVLVTGIMGAVNVRRARAEQASLQSIEELIELRRWPEAALWLENYLSHPTGSPLLRVQALLYLAMVLARYHRFEDSVKVHDFVLEHVALDDATDHAVRLGRAMALLREDNLLDSDRAISELRRASRGTESAGLALVEIYRDVKTGHPNEAIEMFQSRIETMRKNLGHRVGDAWALVARASDLLNRTDEAKAAFEKATLLMPLAELQRRYPEISPLVGKYTPSPAPLEVAS